MTLAAPLANYLAAKRFGNTLYLSGVIAVDSASGQALSRYDQPDATARKQLKALGFDTGQLSVDVFEAPIVVQSHAVLARIAALAAEHGARPEHCARLVQYFKDLRDYAAYNRVRSLFYPEGVVSTVVQVSGMLPGPAVIVEVEATYEMS